ncbi:MAG: Gx transporter family protein [Bacillota bacterium]
MKEIKKISLFSLFLSLALAAHWLENLFIPLPFLPGFRIGFANSFTLLVLLIYGTVEAFVFALLRVVIGSAGSGAFLGPVFYLSLAGSMASVLTMAFLRDFFKPFFSEIGLGIAGAAAYNTIQLLMLSEFWRYRELMSLIPAAAALSIFPGILVGMIAGLMRKRIDLGKK